MNYDAPPTPTGPGWGQSLYSGAAGVALLHAVRAHTGEDDRDALRPWAAAMLKGPIQATTEACGLYEGAPAVAYVLSFTHTNTATRALATLDTHLADVTGQRLKRAHARIDRGALPTLGEFDLISGLTGLGVYHLHRGHKTELRDVLAYLARLTEPITIEAQRLPGWWTGDSPDLRPTPRWPGGHGNFGLAHGITGPLALLTTGLRHGHTVPGQTQAITRICDWLDRWRNGTGSRAWWPDLITRAEHRRGELQRPGPKRPSWCYGTPGIARAQQLAGLALGDRDRQRQAEQALAGCLADDQQLAQLTDASLCHGWAGLIQTVSRAAADALDDELASHLRRLNVRLNKHLDHHGLPDGAGLMDGTAGIHLVCLTDPVNTAITAPWDRCLLLTGGRREPHPPTRTNENDLPLPYAQPGTFRKDAMNTTTGASPEDLRNRLVDAILKEDLPGLRDARVETAMRTVPRHAFLPDAPIEEAYANKSVTIKENPDEDALPLSCASQPDVVHFMLVQLAVREGDNVFEIGAGTGYNAALLKHLTGKSGQVTTCDIDADVTAYARRTLDANGYEDVRVVTRDGALGASEFSPYDRMIATVGMWDLPGAWWGQLAVGGRLVVPLRWRGLSRAVAFQHEEGRMRSDSVKMCGFLPVIGQDGERNDYIDDDRLVRLYWDEDQSVAPELLRDALTRPKSVVWTGVTVGPVESFDGVWLRLSATERATCRITAKPAAVEAGLHRPASPALSPALVEGDSIAYLTLERTAEDPETEPRFRLGAVGYGPAGADLAERICAQIRTWSPARTAEPLVTAYPADTPDSDLADGAVIDRPSVRLVIAY